MRCGRKFEAESLNERGKLELKKALRGRFDVLALSGATRMKVRDGMQV